MFARAVGACQELDAPFGYRFRLTERSMRGYVEPILTSHAFQLSREWMSMELVVLPDAAPAGDEIVQGYRLRPVKPDDVPALINLEERAFASPQLSAKIVARTMKTAAFYRVLEDVSSSRLIGSLVGEEREPGTGHIAVLAVHPDKQRQGLGESMLRWALAEFQSNGARRATLTTNTDNAPAIALYRKLGFVPQEFGFDYRRPIDEDEVRQVLERNRAEHITVNRRWGRR
jgi:ribosomal protein S18 acetylase RimI-like enzyme